MNKNDKFLTFWKLVQEKKIVIPIIQRDYAQGRGGTSDTDSGSRRRKDSAQESDIRRIRKGLIYGICEAAVDKTPMNLNFVYGEEVVDDKINTKLFIPIDGQQRLTTLFLVHWYFFAMASYEEHRNKLQILKNNFSYQTRSTTKRCCENLCDSPEIAAADTISDKLKKLRWFTNSFACDPSVQSICVVLDDIAKTTNKIKKEKGGIDYNAVSEYLTSEECALGFYFLDMKNFDAEDLYIKMNSRGKKLTDFEIFKAKLQDSRALSDYCSGDKERIIRYIGKFNNEYAYLFYREDKDNFDNLMMTFVKDVIKSEHYREAVLLGVSVKEYRDDYSNDAIGQMSGGAFYEEYIERPLIHKRDMRAPLFPESKYRDAVLYSLKKAYDILGFFADNEISVFEKFRECPFNKVYVDQENKADVPDVLNDESRLFYAPQKFQSDVKRYGIYDFICSRRPRGEKQYEAYYCWKRFVWNIARNTNIRSSDIAAHIFALFYLIVSSLPEDYDCDDVLRVIRDFASPHVTTQIYQLQEEKDKARLMLKGPEWKNTILDAENYYADGQIGFLLRFAEGDILKFKHYFEISKLFFDKHKNARIREDFVFERALLSMDDSTEGKRGYLQKGTNTSAYTFFSEPSYNYSEVLSDDTSGDFVKALFDLYSSQKKAPVEFLKDQIDKWEVSENKREEWKRLFIKENLLSKIAAFNDEDNGYSRMGNHFAIFNQNRVILLLKGKQTSSFNIDAATFLLYSSLNCKEQCNLQFETTSSIFDSNNLPLRYIQKGNLRIGFDSDKGKFVDLDSNASYSDDEARDLIEKS